MEPMLQEIAHAIALVIETIAILVIAVGVVDGVIGTLRVGVSPGAEKLQARQLVWLRFARWLVAGMTFQLAADVVGTSFNPSWDELGHLATIAAIRTFLSFFLDREMEAKSEQLQHAERSVSAALDPPDRPRAVPPR